MDQRKHHMLEWYDRVAAVYDDHALPLSPRLAEVLVREAAISPGSSVLDVGTGTGNVAIAAAKRVGIAGHVIAVDLSSAMLVQARQKAGDLPIEFREMDAEALKFANATFDIVLGGILPEIAPVLAETRRVLRPGGRAAFSTYTRQTHQPLAKLTVSCLERHGLVRPYAPPSPSRALEESDQLLRLLEGAGFQDIRVIPKPHTYWLRSTEDWWTYMRRSTRWGGALDRLSPQVLEALKADIHESVESLRSEKGIQVDGAALIGIGARH